LAKTNGNKTKVRALESDFFGFGVFYIFNIFLKIFRHAVSLMQQGFASL
jgi:hypothetical protein